MPLGSLSNRNYHFTDLSRNIAHIKGLLDRIDGDAMPEDKEHLPSVVKG